MDTILILCETGEDKSWGLESRANKHTLYPVRVAVGARYSGQIPACPSHSTSGHRHAILLIDRGSADHGSGVDERVAAQYFPP
jgi:hypothetical protein